MSTAEDLALALQLADAADALTMARHRAPGLRVELKADRTPVTEVDRAVETALRERLGDARPDDAILGEEYGATGEGARRWVLDPIDGTKSYLRATPTWATLIALLDAESVLVGVVSMPALGRRWWASAGGGAFAGGPLATGSPDGESIRVSSVTALADAQMCWSGIHEWDEVGGIEPLLGLGRACWRTRGIGDAWQYMLVAEGSAEIAVDPSVSVWDLAAPSLIVQEAGGRFTSLAGSDGPGGGSGVATNGLVHEAVLDVLGGYTRTA